jgi:hypothetical protein
MAKKPAKLAVVEQASASSLADIVAAGESGTYATQLIYQPLVEAGHVEVNETVTNEHGHVAVRATQKGIDAMNTTTETVTDVTDVAKPVFEIEYGIEPAKVRRQGQGGKTELYPFSQLPAPNNEGKKASFFVPNTSMKKLSSTISGATRRFAIEDESGATHTNRKGQTVPKMVVTRRFHGEDTTSNGVSGVRVFRDA